MAGEDKGRDRRQLEDKGIWIHSHDLPLPLSNKVDSDCKCVCVFQVSNLKKILQSMLEYYHDVSTETEFIIHHSDMWLKLFWEILSNQITLILEAESQPSLTQL